MNFDYRGISGFDISTHQDSPLIAGHVDFWKMRSFGAWFCIHRASNGLTKDTDFDINWPAMKGVLPRATYHYYNNEYEPKAQARAYWNVIKNDPRDAGPV